MTADRKAGKIRCKLKVRYKEINGRRQFLCI